MKKRIINLLPIVLFPLAMLFYALGSIYLYESSHKAFTVSWIVAAFLLFISRATDFQASYFKNMFLLFPSAMVENKPSEREFTFAIGWGFWSVSASFKHIK
jgi:hypothetical protein